MNPNPARIVAMPYNQQQQQSNSPPRASPGMGSLVQRQQMPVVSPGVSPIPQQQPITIPIHAGSGFNQIPQYLPTMTHTAQPGPLLGWQHQQQMPQPFQESNIRTRQDAVRATSDDVSSLHLGSIRPDPRYDPAKDPLHPSNMEKPFVPPPEITIIVVKSRRRSTMDHHDKVEEEAYTQSDSLKNSASKKSSTNNAPMIFGLGTSIDHSGSYQVLNSSFDTDVATYTVGSEEEYQDLRDNLLALQKLHDVEEVPAATASASMEETELQRKGMVRRELKRRMLRFKKKKASNEETLIVDAVNTITIGDQRMVVHPQTPISVEVSKPPKKKGVAYYSPFGSHYNKSKMMTMVVDQENGC